MDIMEQDTRKEEKKAKEADNNSSIACPNCEEPLERYWSICPACLCPIKKMHAVACLGCRLQGTFYVPRTLSPPFYCDQTVSHIGTRKLRKALFRNKTSSHQSQGSLTQEKLLRCDRVPRPHWRICPDCKAPLQKKKKKEKRKRTSACSVGTTVIATWEDGNKYPGRILEIDKKRMTIVWDGEDTYSFVRPSEVIERSTNKPCT
mmetsp:Transcript_8204/g.13264  ORF Transcript_8204/g.13264 Transcript_8204/m.13264 type:complete len:204 (+) Transcript_8204:106-717(+)